MNLIILGAHHKSYIQTEYIQQVTWVNSGAEFVKIIIERGIPDIVYLGNVIYGAMNIISCVEWLIEHCNTKDVSLPLTYYQLNEIHGSAVDMLTKHRTKWNMGKLYKISNQLEYGLSLLPKTAYTKTQIGTAKKLIMEMPKYAINVSKVNVELVRPVIEFKYELPWANKCITVDRKSGISYSERDDILHNSATISENLPGGYILGALSKLSEEPPWLKIGRNNLYGGNRLNCIQ